MKYKITAISMMCLLVCGVLRAEPADTVIHNGSKVAIDYTLTVDGKVLDSSQSSGPLEYVQGDGKLITGLTSKLDGLRAGDEKTIEVQPQDGYGLPNPAAFQEVSMSRLPPGIKPEVGMILQGQGKDGRSFPSRIAEVRKDSVIMDFNHPLAGKTLLFKVKVISVK